MIYKITSVSNDDYMDTYDDGFKKYEEILSKYHYNKQEHTIEINSIEELNQLLLDIEDIKYNHFIENKQLLIDKETITIIDDHIDI